MRAFAMTTAVMLALGLAGMAQAQTSGGQRTYHPPTINTDVARPGRIGANNTQSGGFSLRNLLPNFSLPGANTGTIPTSDFTGIPRPPQGFSNGTEYLKGFGFQRLKLK
jgi:hypothetical protein